MLYSVFVLKKLFKKFKTFTYSESCKFFCLMLVLGCAAVWPRLGQAVTIDRALPHSVYQFSVIYDDYGWYPYMMPKEDTGKGILVDLIPIIFAVAGLPVEIQTLPPARSVSAFEKNQIDFEWSSPAWFDGGKFPASNTSTMPVLRVQEAIVTLESNGQKYPNITSLSNTTVGTINGYNYATDSMFKRLDTSSELNLVRMLLAKHVDVIIIDPLSAQHWAKKLDAKLHFGPIYSDGPLVMRTQRDRNQNIVPRLNAAISFVEESGTLDQIVLSYGLNRQKPSHQKLTN